MITVPPLVGMALAGPAWAHLPLLTLWWTGYFAFFAVGLWLRSGRKPRYLPPVRASTAAMVPSAVAVVIVAPYLLSWAVPFAPLVAATAWASAHRRDRSLLNDVVTVSAAGLMTAVAYDAGTDGVGGIWGTGWLTGSGWWATSGELPGASADGSLTGWAWTWLVTAAVTAYFLGTILYVKTNIRERGSRGYLVASVGFHLLGAVTASGLAAAGVLRPAVAVVWAVLTVRALVVPLLGRRRGRPVRPAVLGAGEIALTAAVAVTILV